MRLEKDGTHTVLSGGGEGKRFNGPNDISIRSDGAIYLADNDFGLRGAGKSPLKELQDGVWRIKDGQTTRVLSDTQLGGIPNGITFSPDEKYLYLTAGRQIKRWVTRYHLPKAWVSATACAWTPGAISTPLVAPDRA
jgi:gluconolactonase